MKNIVIQIGTKLYNASYNESTGDYTITGEASSGESQVTGNRTYNVLKGDNAGSDTNVTIDEVYNQLVLTCDLEDIDTLIDSPTDDDTMVSPYTNKQLYCTEYASFGDYGAWRDMILTGNSNSDDAKVCNHYVQLYKSTSWSMNGDAYIRNDNTRQLDFFRTAATTPCLCFLAAFGHDEPTDYKDNSVQKAPSMDRYLVITANGNMSDEETGYTPSEQTIKNAMPIATYTGNLAGGVFSPTDSQTTNYIVISGKIVATSANQKNSSLSIAGLNEPKYPELYTFMQNNSSSWLIGMLFNRIHLDDDKSDAFYCVKFYDGYTPNSNPTTYTGNSKSLYPYNSAWKGLHELKYGWSANGDETDKISKMPLVACTLKIGDKYAVEKYDSNGKASYEWKTLEECKYVSYNGEKYPQNQIFLGADIKIDDYIIGTEYELANSVLPEYNIEASGIAIPIKASDNLSGKIEFTIDGLVNTRFDEITRRHPTFFRSTKWYHNVKNVLSHINQVMIKNFKMEIYSDNANINNIGDDKDLVYCTEELTDYIEKKDDIDFKLSTALTTQECAEKGIQNKVLMNNPYVGTEPLRSVKNTITGFAGKPEEQYLNDYWPDYNRPHQIVEKTVYESGQRNWTSLVRLAEFSHTYQVTGQSYDVATRHQKLTLREL